MFLVAKFGSSFAIDLDGRLVESSGEFGYRIYVFLHGDDLGVGFGTSLWTNGVLTCSQLDIEKGAGNQLVTTCVLLHRVL